MQRTRLGAIALGATALLGAALASPAVAATETGTTVPTYQEFKDSTLQDTDSQYIVNGDEPAGTNADLREFYDRLVGSDIPTNGLIVNTVGGADDTWSASQELNLTYCVSNKFGTATTTVVNAMSQGAACGRPPPPR